MTKTPKLPSGLSPSSIDLYHQCPKRFQEEKINGHYSPSGIEALLGTFVHRILELLMQFPPEGRTLDQAKICARLAWPESEAEKDLIQLKLTDDQKRNFRWDAWRSVENYFEMEDPTGVEVVSTEQKVNCEINGVPLRGIIDRLDRFGEDLVVSDYKNGKVTDKKYAGPKRDQLNLYAGMVRETEGITPARARLIYTAHKEFMEVAITPDSIDKVLEKAKDTWTAVHASFESGNWAPNPQPLCGWCPFIGKCPEGKAFAFMSFKRGRLKNTAPAYAMFANPKVVDFPKRRVSR